FADVMRSYELPAEEIERHEDAVRRGGYAALRAEERPPRPVVECNIGPDCLARRTVTIRSGAPAAGVAVGRVPPFVEGLRRDGTDRGRPAGDETIRAGDELVLAGTADAFAQAALLFREVALDPLALAEATADTRIMVDTEGTIELHPSPRARCEHLGQIRRVHPSARGCEDCLRIGDRWVHLR